MPVQSKWNAGEVFAVAREQSNLAGCFRTDGAIAVEFLARATRPGFFRFRASSITLFCQIVLTSLVEREQVMATFTPNRADEGGASTMEAPPF